MATLVFFESFSEGIANADIDFGADTFKLYYTNTAPDAAADTNVADFPTEVANGNGYTTGGLTLDSVTVSRSGDTTKISIADEVLSASGAVGPLRYGIIYSSTADLAVCYYDRGSSVTLQSGDTLTANFDDSNGVFTIAPA